MNQTHHAHLNSTRSLSLLVPSYPPNTNIESLLTHATWQKRWFGALPKAWTFFTKHRRDTIEAGPTKKKKKKTEHSQQVGVEARAQIHKYKLHA